MKFISQYQIVNSFSFSSNLSQPAFTRSKFRTETLKQDVKYGVFTVNFEHISKPCSSVSIVNFKQVNVDWVLPFLPFSPNGSQYQPSPFLLGGQLSVPHFGQGESENKCLEGLKEFLPKIFAWGGGLLCFLSKKTFKMKYGYED